MKKDKIFNYFTRKELECRCGCGLMNMDNQFMYAIYQMRVLSIFQFIVTSASRCQQHNKDVGGHPESYHLIGRAIDISRKNIDSMYLHRLIKYAMFSPSTELSIGIGSGFIHLDNRKEDDSGAPVFWIYGE